MTTTSASQQPATQPSSTANRPTRHRPVVHTALALSPRLASLFNAQPQHEYGAADEELFALMLAPGLSPFASAPAQMDINGLSAGQQVMGIHWGPLITELGPLLNDPQRGPIDLSLLLPKLGEVNVCAQLINTQRWAMELSFANRLSNQLVKRHRRQLQQQLNHNSRYPVDLFLSPMDNE